MLKLIDGKLPPTIQPTHPTHPPPGNYALLCTKVALRLAASLGRTGAKHSPGRVPNTSTDFKSHLGDITTALAGTAPSVQPLHLLRPLVAMLSATRVVSTGGCSEVAKAASMILAIRAWFVYLATIRINTFVSPLLPISQGGKYDARFKMLGMISFALPLNSTHFLSSFCFRSPNRFPQV